MRRERLAETQIAAALQVESWRYKSKLKDRHLREQGFKNRHAARRRLCFSQHPTEQAALLVMSEISQNTEKILNFFFHNFGLEMAKRIWVRRGKGLGVSGRV